MKPIVFKGSAAALVTPMRTDGAINWELFGLLLDRQLEQGSDAVLICGTTGESATLSEREHIDAIAFAADRVDGRIPVIAGAGSNSTACAVRLSKEAERAGADALLHVTLYYNKSSQAGLLRHFSEIADAAALPVILYNVPSRTGCCIQPETCRKLAAHPNINAIKEASGNLSAVSEIAQRCGGELWLYAGNDDQTLPVLSVGGLGVISVCANLIPSVMHEICALWFADRAEQSRMLFLRYLDLMRALFVDVNPIPVKQALCWMGFDAGPCRLPLVGMSERDQRLLRTSMQACGLL